jgi:tetratricopeptide (TPR) repeat protein
VKRTAATIAILLALGVLAACSATSRDYYVKGKDLMITKDYTGALAAFNQGLESDPESPLLTYEKARALYNLERWQEAMDVLKRFQELTDAQKSSYANERWNADFWIKKCEEHLGITREPAREDKDKGDESSSDEDFIGGMHMKTR